MGKTNTQKQQQREERLKQLPRSERLAKQAQIKKKEGRVLDAAEKHALKMTSEYGEIMRLWELLRTLPQTDERKRAMKNTAAAADEEAPADEEGSSANTAIKTTTSGGDDDADSGSNPKFKVVKKLYKIIFPKFDEMIKTPKISRVLQSCVKYGSNDQLLKLSSELAKQFVHYSTDAYAHYVVCAMFRHVPHALYNQLLKLVLNNMPALIKHKFGMLVINAAYTNKLCSQADRNHVVLGVFKDSVAIMKSWPGYPILEDILGGEGEHKKRLITSLFNLVDKLVSVKEAYELPFVQRMVAAFIRHGTKSEVMELCQTLKPQVVKLMATKEGSELASLVFALLHPKSRKDVLRQVSENFVELACDKFAAPVVARMFDLVYDGQLLYKFLSSQLVEAMPTILSSPYAHLIILHLLTPDEGRKRRALFPNWFDHNLYSQGNANWNTHHWLDDHHNKETVEICPKDAQRTHVMVLGPIVRKFFEFAAAAADREAPEFPRHFVGRVAKEIHHLMENEPLYAEAMAVTPEEAALLVELLPNNQKRQRDGEDDDDHGDDKKKPKAPQKKATTSTTTPVKSATTTAAATTTPRSASALDKKKMRKEGEAPASASSPKAESDAPVEHSARAPPAAVGAATTPSASAKKAARGATTPTPTKGAARLSLSSAAASSGKKHKKFSD